MSTQHSTQHNPSSPAVRMSSHATAFAVMAVLGGFTQLISLQPWLRWPHEDMVWLPGATLMCAMLSRPHNEWAACFSGTSLGAVAVLVTFGVPVIASTVIVVGLLVLVAVASWAMRSLRRSVSPLEDYRQIWVFLMVAAVALPLLAAGWIWLVAEPLGLKELVKSWTSLVLAHSVAYLLLLPGFVAVLRVYRHPERRVTVGQQHMALCLSFALVLGIAWLQPWPDPVMRPALALAATMLLMWALLVFGTAGAFIALFCCTFLSMLISSFGLGPLVVDTQTRTTLAVQLWALSASALLLVLTPVAEQRQTAKLSLERAYQRLTDLTQQMLRVQEEERARIARDLHDDINQSLASISIQLSALKRKTQPDWPAQVEDLQERLLEVSGDVRRISHELHPSLLRYTSLATALQSLCDNHPCQDRTRLQCDVSEDLTLNNEDELNLFRIAQEAVHNVSRHARAQNAWIHLYHGGGETVLQVDDDGVGLSTGEPCGPIKRGLGMISIEERARLLGGTSNLSSRAEGGSRLEVRFMPRQAKLARGGSNPMPLPDPEMKNASSRGRPGRPFNPNFKRSA